MHRNQSPISNQGSDACQAGTIAALLLAAIAGAFILPLWVAATMMFVALVVLRTLAMAEPVPVVIRRDPRR